MVIWSEDVARRAGVSRSTVSQILNGRPAKFSDSTRARVLQAAADLGYEPSAAGRTLARGSSDLVIALIPNTTFSGNLQDIFEDMTDQLAAHGLSLVLRLAARSTESLSRILAGLQPAAVFSLTPFTADERTLLDRHDVPGIDPATVTGTDYDLAIGSAQAGHLIERGYGRLAFARLHDARDDPYSESRLTGVRDACREAGLPAPQVVQLAIDPGEALAALDKLGPPGVAVACYNDDVAIALLLAATVRGWRTPEDLALVGVDASPLSRITLPPLTTVAYDFRAIVNSSTHTVLKKLGRATGEPDLSERSIHIVRGGTT